MSPGKEKCTAAPPTSSGRRNKSWDFQGSYSLRSHEATTFAVCFTHSLNSSPQVFNVELSFPSRRFHAFFCLQFFQGLLFAPDSCLQLAAPRKGNSTWLEQEHICNGVQGTSRFQEGKSHGLGCKTNRVCGVMSGITPGWAGGHCSSPWRSSSAS